MKIWKCTVCGYIHHGEEAPDNCPNCKAPAEKFVELNKDPEKVHGFYGEGVDYGKEVVINTFFNDYNSIQPHVYNLPVGSEVPLHKHPTTDEFIYIIKGRVGFEVKGKQFVATPGDTVKIHMNTPHKFNNAGDEPVVFLSVKGPKPVDLEML